jgi:hypothetical protein
MLYRKINVKIYKKMENPLWNLEEGIYTEVMGKWNEIGTNGKLEWNYFILLGFATESFL